MGVAVRDDAGRFAHAHSRRRSSRGAGIRFHLETASVPGSLARL
jgi:hypothetical protein